MTTAELVRVEQAAEAASMPTWLLRRRLREAGALVFDDPLDRRRRLVRRADVERLLQPRLLRGKEVTTA